MKKKTTKVTSPAKKTKRSTRLRRAAYHEAGHAAYLIAFGLPFKRVSLEESAQSTRGFVLMKYSETGSESLKEVIIRRATLLATCFVGAMAESKLTGEPQQPSAQDLENAARVMSQFKKRDAAGNTINLNQSDKKKFEALGKKFAKEFLGKELFWSGIQGLAERLMATGVLSHAEAKRIFYQCMGEYEHGTKKE